jgi:hypothetical protein
LSWPSSQSPTSSSSASSLSQRLGATSLLHYLINAFKTNNNHQLKHLVPYIPPSSTSSFIHQLLLQATEDIHPEEKELTLLAFSIAYSKMHCPHPAEIALDLSRETSPSPSPSPSSSSASPSSFSSLSPSFFELQHHHSFLYTNARVRLISHLREVGGDASKLETEIRAVGPSPSTLFSGEKEREVAGEGEGEIEKGNIDGKARSKDSSFYTSWNLFQVTKDRKPEQAEKIYKHLEATGKLEFKHGAMMLTMYAKLHDEAKALKLFEQLSELKPDDEAIHAAMILLYSQGSLIASNEKAEEYFKMASL